MKAVQKCFDVSVAQFGMFVFFLREHNLGTIAIIFEKFVLNQLEGARRIRRYISQTKARGWLKTASKLKRF